MNIFDSIGAGLSKAVVGVIEANRKQAQLNRLATVIKCERQTLDKAYIALGKHYYASLNGEESTEKIDITAISAVIKESDTRLKKAQDRYLYIEQYGMPDIDEIDKEEKPQHKSVQTKDENDDYDEEDITICCTDDTKTEKNTDESAKIPEEEKPVEETQDSKTEKTTKKTGGKKA